MSSNEMTIINEDSGDKSENSKENEKKKNQKIGSKINQDNEILGKRVPKKRTTYDTTKLNGEAFYDCNGITIKGEQDICDCLRSGCPGCHFPCKQCSSHKCGNKCRVFRNWYYEKVEYEGTNDILVMEMGR